MTTRKSTYWRRLALATLFAGTATFSASAFGDPATACAAPREWDVGRYDSCVADALALYQTGSYTFQDYHEDVQTCCLNTGGVLSETQGCVAPVGEQAQEAERQPVPPAPPDFGMATLYMPPPPGPVAPPPSEAILAP